MSLIPTLLTGWAALAVFDHCSSSAVITWLQSAALLLFSQTLSTMYNNTEKRVTALSWLHSIGKRLLELKTHPPLERSLPDRVNESQSDFGDVMQQVDGGRRYMIITCSERTRSHSYRHLKSARSPNYSPSKSKTKDLQRLWQTSSFYIWQNLFYTVIWTELNSEILLKSSSCLLVFGTNMSNDKVLWKTSLVSFCLSNCFRPNLWVL